MNVFHRKMLRLDLFTYIHALLSTTYKKIKSLVQNTHNSAKAPSGGCWKKHAIAKQETMWWPSDCWEMNTNLALNFSAFKVFLNSPKSGSNLRFFHYIVENTAQQSHLSWPQTRSKSIFCHWLTTTKVLIN